jgi:hypothetical protein
MQSWPSFPINRWSPYPVGPASLAKRQLTVFGRKFDDELACRRFRGVDLAEIANLPVTTLLRDRNGIAQLGRIDSDESPAMLVHDSPSLFEALPGQSG